MVFWCFHGTLKEHGVTSVCVRSFCGPYSPAFGLNTRKHGLEQLQIRTLFTQWRPVAWSGSRRGLCHNFHNTVKQKIAFRSKTKTKSNMLFCYHYCSPIREVLLNGVYLLNSFTYLFVHCLKSFVLNLGTNLELRSSQANTQRNVVTMLQYGHSIAQPIHNVAEAFMSQRQNYKVAPTIFQRWTVSLNHKVLWMSY